MKIRVQKIGAPGKPCVNWKNKNRNPPLALDAK